MKVRDSRKRKIKDSAGNVYTLKLRRLQCINCGQIHTEIPDFIEKFKHYSKPTIDMVLQNEANIFSGDNKTIYRWKKK